MVTRLEQRNQLFSHFAKFIDGRKLDVDYLYPDTNVSSLEVNIRTAKNNIEILDELKAFIDSPLVFFECKELQPDDNIDEHDWKWLVHGQDLRICLLPEDGIVFLILPSRGRYNYNDIVADLQPELIKNAPDNLRDLIGYDLEDFKCSLKYWTEELPNG